MRLLRTATLTAFVAAALAPSIQLAQGAPWWAAKTCFAPVFHQLLGERQGDEAGLLAEFDSRNVAIGSVRRLSEGVYLVADLQGRKYVVRLPSEKSDLLREQFASHFFRKAMPAPASRLLSHAESSSLLKRIAAREPDGSAAQLLEWWDNDISLEHGQGNVSVTAFVPATGGKAKLASLVAHDPMRDELIRLSDPAMRFNPNEARGRSKDIASIWGKLGPAAKMMLVHDLRRLLPEMKMVPLQGFLEHLLAHPELLVDSRLQGLAEIGIGRIPPEVRRQLADAWLLYTVLGISDFHPDNWLVHNDQVIGIDLALQPTVSRVPGRPLQLARQMHPFGFYELSEPVRARLMSEASSKVKQYLRSLTETSLHSLAQETGYRLSASEAKHILERAAAVPVP